MYYHFISLRWGSFISLDFFSFELINAGPGPIERGKYLDLQYMIAPII